MHPHPSRPYPLSSLPLLPLHFSFLSHVHLHVCGKGVERMGDGGAGGLFREPQSQWYISHMTNYSTHTHTSQQTDLQEDFQHIHSSTELGSYCRFSDRRKEDTHDTHTHTRARDPKADCVKSFESKENEKQKQSQERGSDHQRLLFRLSSEVETSEWLVLCF